MDFTSAYIQHYLQTYTLEILKRAPIFICALVGGLARVALEIYRQPEQVLKTKVYCALMFLSIFTGMLANEILLASGKGTNYGYVVALSGGLFFEDVVKVFHLLGLKYLRKVYETDRELIGKDDRKQEQSGENAKL